MKREKNKKWGRETYIHVKWIQSIIISPHKNFFRIFQSHFPSPVFLIADATAAAAIVLSKEQTIQLSHVSQTVPLGPPQLHLRQLLQLLQHLNQHNDHKITSKRSEGKKVRY